MMAPAPTPSLSNSRCGSPWAITNRAVLSVYRPLLEPLGLTYPQLRLLRTLGDMSPAGT